MTDSWKVRIAFGSNAAASSGGAPTYDVAAPARADVVGPAHDTIHAMLVSRCASVRNSDAASSELHPARGAVKQAEAELCFELPDQAGDHGLRHPRPLRARG